MGITQDAFTRLLRTLSTIDQSTELSREEAVQLGLYLTKLWRGEGDNHTIEAKLINSGLNLLREVSVKDHKTAKALLVSTNEIRSLQSA